MQDVVAAIQGQLSNQFLSGGLVLMAFGAFIAIFRTAPLRIWNWMHRQYSIVVDVRNTDYAFDWLSLWLDRQPYSKKARRLSVSTIRSSNDSSERSIVFTPAPGNHFFMYQGRLIWLTRELKDDKGGAGDSGASTAVGKPRETYYIRLLGRKQTVVRDLIEEARKLADAQRKELAQVYAHAWGSWNCLGPVVHRTIESVVLPGRTAMELVEDVQVFLGARKWYVERGVPYRRGYLLHGIPGSGKTSLITALAGHLKLNLYVVNIAARGMSDDSLMNLMSSIEDDSIVLFEDIDAAAPARKLPGEKSSKEGETSTVSSVTLSGLLNALDGVVAKEGSIVFLTTNFRERLDPALIRPGRVDREIPFTWATPEQIATIFTRFFPGTTAAPAFARAVTRYEVSMAEVQQHLLKYRDSEEAAFDRAEEVGQERREWA